MISIPKVALLAMLNTLKASGKPLAAPTVSLFVNTPTLDKDTAIGDFVEPTFGSYATSSAVTWLTPYYNSLDQPELAGDVKQWVATSVTTPETVMGYFVLDAAGNYLWAEYLDEPVDIGDIGDSVLVEPVFALASQAA